MKILFLNASPLRRGNISQMVNEMSEEARALGAEVEIVEVQRLMVKPCIACMKCRTSGYCILPDDGSQHVLELINDCDALVIAAPCYWGNIPGTLKLLFDRMVYGLMSENSHGFPIPLQKGKRCILVSTSTTPWPFNIIMHQSHASLDKFRAKFKDRLGQPYILYTKDVMEKGGIVHLPLYMAMFL